MLPEIVTVQLGQYCENQSIPSTHELFSRVFLTLMELWVALDRAVINLAPLLADYSPELTFHSLEPLVLLELSQLKRLHDVEQYLTARHTRAKYRQYSLFTSATPHAHLDPFQRYFDADYGMQTLRTDRKHQLTRRLHGKKE